MKNYLFTAVLCGFMVMSSAAQQLASREDQLRSALKKDFFTVSILLQSEGRFSFADDNFQGGRTFSVPNARVSIKGKFDSGFFYRLYVDAAPAPALLDAYAGYRVNESFSIAAGAMKPRQTLDYIPGPAEHNFVDRAEITGLLVGSREIGVSAAGDIGGFYYYTGIFNGNRLNSNNNNKFYGIGRLQYRAENLFPGYVQFAVSGSHGNSEGTISGGSGPLLRGQRTMYGSDLEFRSGRLYLAAEYLRGELETVDYPNLQEVISGGYVTGGLELNEKTMVFTRWQTWSAREAGTLQRKVTLGTKIAVTDVVGAVVNIDALLPQDGSRKYGASFIFQVQF